ncbi:hypothetical protein I7I51_04568 [Histoplasma capsulatum]|uniref:Uncharacterized protein n=1 Tax=Ajellomyces capsulatus TaxID=5037 RepID=A0A8A1M5P4_AJECA|nr:hypothetical protein I7I51_04568 [Histoplasma capsulatum]
MLNRCNDFPQANNILPPHQLFVACLQTRFVLQIHAGWHTFGTYGGNVSALHKKLWTNGIIRFGAMWWLIKALRTVCPHQSSCKVILTVHPVKNIESSELWSVVVVMGSSPIRVFPGRWVGVDQF